MDETQRAKSLVEDCALKGMRSHQIYNELEKVRLNGYLSEEKVEEIITAVAVGKHFATPTAGPCLPKLIGVIAVIMGIGGILLQTTAHNMPARASPGGLAIAAVVLGLALLFKPSWLE
jgi:hypothetical protein